tara:strand:+ start:829 stop:1623 length:795 start_codon:yes stop_codon:yes gene_type:complete
MSNKNKIKIIGIIPARMSASRFPGKPLKNICGIPMIRHVIERVKLYRNWSYLCVATCDKEIYEYCCSINFPVIMTSKKHKRALDRVKEAAENLHFKLRNEDIVINVQGDEPMLKPDMINAILKPYYMYKDTRASVLCMNIVSEEQYKNPDIVKVVHNLFDDIIYTSRSPIPYSKKFDEKLGAKRIYGIFSFKWRFLKVFSSLKESPLEIKESCDSNRLYDNKLNQKVSNYRYFDSFSVDSINDLKKVEKFMINDKLWLKYNKKL